ncbi:MAG: tRNA dihydrouridine(20/20a) synthase DusA [Limnospira sp. PMC 1291.21]|uniref:tRNA-dihydrouridine(20/20a) synthase n=3 Tax=Sirenicapillariaceae TaxID=2934961 RepID=B5W7K2_LIMMA|nr:MULTISPECIES: tRNA dihydrouridine(20/20a) synthase DusA [Limnospira]MDC0836622.1 tRNA dihydrouridine(20/20a) synthase DusA [Limnoraphis robusta]MDY7052642.1 tRNA dihydrouridine(20/20a) synthase DusA [Limnospira fusiformis LS22]EDZ92504.1 TIM-barrel protein, yjbN family [Limnospira maxima CS-328]MDT9176973.1 tRNA dihydrouridine(20/20a) synthase DusA [Limnospira sp. PMC 1238.20]MDT9186312.1 tRNA dihydrouridine(20/20a) synthase DusA [Limnospira sp. PMC 894.15]
MILNMTAISPQLRLSEDNYQSHILSIAPMMDRTDRHFRYFMRQITRRPLLYTEMVTSAAIINGDRHKLLDFSPEEKPLALQVGGDDPNELATCAKIAEDWGYDEINLNVGCPSARVQNGNFGACLMAEPERVAQAISAMKKAVNIPVTVKHRIGIDNRDRYEDMAAFVRVVAASGCQRFTVHARKAWLQGLSPKDNRNIPPLRYGDVHRLKAEFPDLTIEINGGFTTLEQVKQQLTKVDAVMIGRAAYDNPYLFAIADREIYGENINPPTRHQVVEQMLPYIENWLSQGGRLNSVVRHILQLFAGQPGTKAWKRYLSENAHLPGAGVEVVKAALAEVP